MLVDSKGRDLRQEERREMKAGMTKQTLKGEIRFLLKVDMPKDVSQDEFDAYLKEYFNIGSEAFKDRA